jgi:hypothetical protein
MAPKPTRKSVPDTTMTEVLTACRRRCAICFGLHRDTTLKQGQIAHLDHDASNAAADNLIFLCLVHHDEYDSRRSQSKGITQGEVRHYRDELTTALNETLRAPVWFGSGDRGLGLILLDNYTGTWIRVGDDESDSAEFKMDLVAPDRVKVKGLALHGRDRDSGPNLGIIKEFVGRLENGAVTWTETAADGSRYTLVLRFADGSLIAAEEGFPPFGVGVSYAGHYRRA